MFFRRISPHWLTRNCLLSGTTSSNFKGFVAGFGGNAFLELENVPPGDVRCEMLRKVFFSPCKVNSWERAVAVVVVVAAAVVGCFKIKNGGWVEHHYNHHEHVFIVACTVTTFKDS